MGALVSTSLSENQLLHVDNRYDQNLKTTVLQTCVFRVDTDRLDWSCWSGAYTQSFAYHC